MDGGKGLTDGSERRDTLMNNFFTRGISEQQP